jgi:SAM-dependent methyltransferase
MATICAAPATPRRMLSSLLSFLSDLWFSLLWRLLGARIDAALRPLKAELLSSLSGTVVDLGSGCGATLPYLSSSVQQLYLIEPNSRMHRDLRAAVQSSAQLRSASVHILGCGAEVLPLPDASVDAVVSVLTFCSISEPAAAVAEALRVLKPGGKLLFLEHVRASPPGALAALQRAADATLLYGWLSGGCRLHRDTVGLIQQAVPAGSWQAVQHSTEFVPGFPLPLARGWAEKRRKGPRAPVQLRYEAEGRGQELLAQGS